MKTTMQAAAVAVLGMALAGAASMAAGQGTANPVPLTIEKLPGEPRQRPYVVRITAPAGSCRRLNNHPRAQAANTLKGSPRLCWITIARRHFSTGTFTENVAASETPPYGDLESARWSEYRLLDTGDFPDFPYRFSLAVSWMNARGVTNGGFAGTCATPPFDGDRGDTFACVEYRSEQPPDPREPTEPETPEPETPTPPEPETPPPPITGLTVTPTGRHEGLEVRVTVTASDHDRYRYPVRLPINVEDIGGTDSGDARVGGRTHGFSIDVGKGRSQSRVILLPRHARRYRFHTTGPFFVGLASGGSEGHTIRSAAYATPQKPGPTEPETPTPPEPEAPEPETPEPESCPVERCDHLAIVPTIPRAMSGDEDAPDHWLRITNPGTTGIAFKVTGRDGSGKQAGTYRRELPAYRSVIVKMRDVEAAFDAKPEGHWWRLVVEGLGGPVEVTATMRQGDARRFVPVERPATCATGPVTRAD